MAEEICNKINETKKLQNIFCDQMFSKELKLRRNNALTKRRDYLQTNKNMQVKLECPTTLKASEKGSNTRWSVLEEF